MNEISGRTNINQRGFSGAANDSDGGDETFMDLTVSHAARLLLGLSSFSSVHHRTACPSRSKRVLSGDGAADGQMDAGVPRFRSASCRPQREPPQINTLKTSINHTVTWDTRPRPPSSGTRTPGTNSGKLNGFLSGWFDPQTEEDVGQRRHLQDVRRHDASDAFLLNLVCLSRKILRKEHKLWGLGCCSCGTRVLQKGHVSSTWNLPRFV